MVKKILYKFRNESIRLQNWDYGWNGSYFITICTKDRFPYFGEIENGEMILNEIGQLAQRYWTEIPNHFSFVKLGNFVVMPDHTHGILIIDKTVADIALGVGPDIAVGVGPRHCLGPTRFQNQGKHTISSIVGSYKSVTTKNARYINPDFGWQSLFYDHIIRDQGSFNRIQKYIADNPKNWNRDKL